MYCSLTSLLPLNENETLLTPPTTLTINYLYPFVQLKIVKTELCSSIPVPIVKILGSKIISCGGKSTFSVKISWN